MNARATLERAMYIIKFHSNNEDIENRIRYYLDIKTIDELSLS